ncbi:MAG TPA: DUF427 domain-containing protein [Thermomicrobiales bacterium]|nr:DUF427 domain-containing protein [Thermomicrobiales bacterium]
MTGQESVWDYPRPPRLERSRRHVRVVFNNVVIADSTRAWRVLETSHPPVFYIPREDVRSDALTNSDNVTFCEFKGTASYWSVTVDGRESKNAAWSYEQLVPDFASIAGHLAFYPSRVDACYVDDERVTPQASDFYGGWMTRDIVGPFKGDPDTRGW